VDWIEKYGDPRAGNVDPVDWVEAVPYAETRGYIQKVLQNTQVYRSRLDPGSMRGMMADLSRGRAGGALAVANTEDSGTAKCGEEASDLASLIRECQ
jgi:soluble lytic murein transglycosylase